MAKNNHNIGIIGCGKIAQKHLDAYHKHKNVQIFITDLNKENQKIASQYGATWVDDASDILFNKEITAVDICTPTSSHVDLALAALENNKYIFCEKPLTLSLREAQLIQDTAARMGSFGMVGYLYRFHKAFKLIKEVLDNDIIGEPYYAIFRIGGRGSHQNWKHQKHTGGGAISEMLVHMLDLALWYFGDFEKVDVLHKETVLKQRAINGKVSDADAEDLVAITLRSKSNVRVFCKSDLITPSYMNYIEVHGHNGSIWTSIMNVLPTIIYCNEPRGVYKEGQNYFQVEPTNLFDEQLGYFIHCLDEKTSPQLNSIDDSIHIARLIEQIREHPHD